jgi:hypothetical protein
MTIRPAVLLALALSLAACASAQQTAQRDEERCAARGYKPNTKEFETCMLDLETARTVRRDTRHREMMERSANPLPR